nr:DUF6069 family protein [uncultured Actinoplanes sp.]
MTATSARNALTITAAIAGALALWTVTDPIAGIDLAVRQGPVGPGAVIVTSLLAGLAAWALLAVMRRTLTNPQRAWTITATVVLAISLLGPLGSASNAASALVLTGMHLLVGAVLIIGLRRSALRGDDRARR